MSMFSKREVVFVETERLVLRSAQSNDLPPLHDQVFSDPDVSKYVFTGGIFTEQQSLDFFESKFNFGGSTPYGFCVISEKETNNVVGFAGLIKARHLETEDYEFGYVLAPNYWGKGYATEIAIAQVNWALKTLGLTQVFALVHQENKASVNVLNKLKMSQDPAVILEGQGKRLVFKATRPYKCLTDRRVRC